MKKCIVAAMAVMLSINIGMPQMSVIAKDVDVKTETEKDGIKETSGEEKPAEINQIQIPQKLQVVIDPWEIDGKGQIYSEQYIIRNTGKTAGILTLSDLACKTGENSGVTVKDYTQGLHDDKNKSVYMELKIGNKEKIVLSGEGAVYQAEMKPGEELALIFSGEVNENASNGWKDGDIGVTVTYSWEMKAVPEEVVSQALEEEKTEEAEDNTDTEEEKKEELIELSEAGEAEFAVDSWKTDEEGNICSIQYILKNTGESTGRLAFTGFACKPEEESGIAVWTDKKTLHDSEDKYICMEFVLTEEEKYILPQEQENEEGFKYEVELKPGAELTFRLVGELNGVLPEDLKKGDIKVKAVYSWVVEEATAEEAMTE